MSEGNKVEATLALRREGLPLVGRGRIELLDAVATHGSISKAAKAVGLSYKAAWDALNAINNLLPRPAIVGQSGGRRGGGATVTEEGHALIAGFRLLEERLSRVVTALAGDGSADALSLIWTLGMKTSIRNAFRCTVTEIRPGAVNAEVLMRLSATCTLTATISMESLHDLGLAVGAQVMALLQASFVTLMAVDDDVRISARNRVTGTVIQREDGAVNSEFTLDIGDGKSLTAMVTSDSAKELGLAVGDRAIALFKASHLILAVG